MSTPDDIDVDDADDDGVVVEEDDDVPDVDGTVVDGVVVEDDETPAAEQRGSLACSA